MGHNICKGMQYEIRPDSYAHRLLQIPTGTYDVYVGDWGWDDGDLYILVGDKRRKLKELDGLVQAWKGETK